MKIAYLPVVALGALLTAGMAHATIISGTGTFSDDGPSHNGLNFTGVTHNGAITNQNLTVGAPLTVNDFLTISSTDTTAGWFGTAGATDTISETFNFTLPSAETGSLSGSGTEDVSTFLGIVDAVSGNISWNNPLNIDFTDGSILSISLSDASFGGLFASPNESVGVDATFKLVQGPSSSSDPTQVPEPGTLALMAAGLLGLCVLRRRSRSSI